VAVEPMGEREEILGDAVRNAGEQLQRAALFPGEVWFFWGPSPLGKAPAGQGGASSTRQGLGCPVRTCSTYLSRPLAAVA
jgi:hypothetical protein